MFSKILDPVLNVVRFHKLKILALFGAYLLFVYLLFPFNDLGDLVATKISQLTQNQVVVDFDNLALSLFPQPGLSLSNVSVETPFTPSLSAKSLEVAPNIAGLLAFKPGVTVRADDLLGGDVTLTTRGGDKTAAGKLKQKVGLDFSKLNLGSLSKFGDLPVKLEGFLSGSMDSQIDPDMGEQPSGNLDAHLERVVIPEGSISTMMGPIALPHLNLNDVSFVGNLDKGTLDISKFVVGRPGGDLYISMSGKIDVKVMRGGPMPVTTGGYELNIHMQVGEAFKQSGLASYLVLLQPYQGANNSYAFSMAGAGPEAPPRMARIQ